MTVLTVIFVVLSFLFAAMAWVADKDITSRERKQ